MKSAHRNVTVTLEEDVARWARIEAARQDTSVSRMLGEILRERMQQSDEYKEAMQRFLSRRPFLNTDGKYLMRDEVHERNRLR